MDHQAPPIIWRPTPKQAEFLSASEDEVLFGGSAGGGKSDALVVDALGLGLSLQAVAQPEYRALILRRTYGELKEIVDRTRALYPQVCPGAVFNQQDSEWRFPSGARIELSYLGQESDQMRYQSGSSSILRWEELAQWPTVRFLPLPDEPPTRAGAVGYPVFSPSDVQPGWAWCALDRQALWYPALG